jgi:hypothetical protein
VNKNKIQKVLVLLKSERALSRHRSFVQEFCIIHEEKIPKTLLEEKWILEPFCGT